MSDDKHQEHRERYFIPVKYSSLIDSPVKVKHITQHLKVEEKLEFDPDRIKPGEVVIVEVSLWMGLKKAVWVIMNIGGRYFRIQQLM